jgi:DNA polymerase
LCWYAQQEDILQVYDRGGDVYKETGASIFGKKAEDITGDERFLAKTVVLGSGYGLGFAGLQRNLAGYGIDATEEEAKRLTYGYRERFHHVVMWWQEIMGAMRDALAGDDGTIRLFGGLVFALHGENDISIELNTGNKLWYREVQWEVKPAPWDENQMLNVMTARNYSSDTARYDLTHSIIAENICSMTAREILARGMLRCELAGYPPVMSVHDEVILEVPVGFGSIEEVDRLLCEQPWYAKRLPLATEAFRSVRYCK